MIARIWWYHHRQLSWQHCEEWAEVWRLIQKNSIIASVLEIEERILTCTHEYFSKVYVRQYVKNPPLSTSAEGNRPFWPTRVTDYRIVAWIKTLTNCSRTEPQGDRCTLGWG